MSRLLALGGAGYGVETSQGFPLSCSRVSGELVAHPHSPFPPAQALAAASAVKFHGATF